MSSPSQAHGVELHVAIPQASTRVVVASSLQQSSRIRTRGVTVAELVVLRSPINGESVDRKREEIAGGGDVNNGEFYNP
ncbi:hypothetical protein LINPERPRIM_LOCUS25695 [Linum perenne]